ncbi:Band 7 protein CG42540-like Protein [Tribolium castaneum]|uniref:Band 7 protein CG42540-like Protein n=1 Tax=Tribolium castaneum TaxID=7070 RepID=A0A139WK92_TRICA|nr:Band 7 protein CG42540-like Protein [Tribolium castaneum]
MSTAVTNGHQAPSEDFAKHVFGAHERGHELLMGFTFTLESILSQQRLVSVILMMILLAAELVEEDTKMCGKILTVLSWMIVVLTMPFSLFVCFKVVQEYERAVIFRLGRLLSGGAKGPGIFFILPCIDAYARVDLRTRTYDIPPQEVLTKDSVTVSVDAVVYYRVSNATVSIANVENAHHSTRLLAQTTLRNIMGQRPLHEILSERESISQHMKALLDEATDSWGINVERVEIKDVRLPIQLQRAMAAEAEAAREARAKVIAAEGEQKASRALREASEVIGDSPAALQLRYLQHGSLGRFSRKRGARG